MRKRSDDADADENGTKGEEPVKKMYCPFCGGTVSTKRIDTGLWYVECENCEKYPPPIYYREKDAITLWQIDANEWQAADAGAGETSGAATGATQ